MAVASEVVHDGSLDETGALSGGISRINNLCFRKHKGENLDMKEIRGEMGEVQGNSIEEIARCYEGMESATVSPPRCRALGRNYISSQKLGSSICVVCLAALKIRKLAKCLTAQVDDFRRFCFVVVCDEIFEGDDIRRR
ncbi:unnamed protein product [Cuscuta europaea]|uniref:Uncharacterized protein n=1 Tax=Cuscuta europaea TaxID=41803 RepID=A0A9P0ZGC3_CUSEU|nr:unnamed protein product [Cuscuta europaea]